MRILFLFCFIFSSVHFSFSQFTSSNLPIILIETPGGVDITKEKIDAIMKVIYNPGQRNFVEGPFNNYFGNISIKGRGSSSWERFDKKGYTLETRLSTGENNNVPLLGMPPENDWVLHGPYADKTLMKNAVVYDLGAELGRYTPRHHYCELLINGEYRGVYLLVERIKRDKNRIDIAKLNPTEISGDDLTGGYILRIDRQEEYYWNSIVDFGFGLSFINYYSPDPALMPQVQKDYIRNYVTDFEEALLQQPFSDLSKGYRNYINLPSFIDYFIINELTKNLDAYRLSAYLYKDKDSNAGRLTMGPLWDYNLSSGGVDIGFGEWPNTAENWVSDEIPNGPIFWWDRFLEDTYYTTCLKTRWSSLREQFINETFINSIIDDYAVLLDEAKDRNFEIFPLEEAVWGNNHSGFTYAEEVDTLKGFLRERIKWMDQAITVLPAIGECNECFTCPPEPILSTELPISELKVYPNPFENNLHIEFSDNGFIDGEMVLYDLTGRIVKREYFELSAGENKVIIDVSELPGQGAYIYKILSDSRPVVTGKLIKK